MRVLREFWQHGHGDAEETLKGWFKICERSRWSKFAEVRSQFPSVDQVGEKLIFNIKGNEYRVIAAINYDYRVVLVKWVGNHREYSKLSRRDIENL